MDFRAISKGGWKYFIITLTLIISCESQDNNKPSGVNFSEQPLKLRSYYEEMLVNQFIMDISKANQRTSYVLSNATLIEPETGEVIPEGIIVVDNGIILYSGSSNNLGIDIDESFERIDIEGQYVIPGLIDMHVHTVNSNNQKLLNLINGVTSVREMAGQQWMINVREQIKNDSLLAPNLYVASNMLNYYSLGMHTTVVKDAEDVEKVISGFKTTGYDFVKVWNNMPENLFKEVIKQSNLNGLKVVGHIPTKVRIEEALPKMHTVEHMKGYVSNSNQEITTEDYVNLTQKYSPWLCPTFYASNVGLYGEEADSLINHSEISKYISPYEIQEWIESKQINDNLGESSPYVKQLNNMKIVFKKLERINPNYISGTDSGGGYSFLVPGFGLHDEIFNFFELGLSPLEALQTATSNASKALGKEGELGTLKKGSRADFIVLNNNPLDNIYNIKRIEKVVIRGRIIDSTILNQIKKILGDIYKPEKDLFASQEQAVADIVKFYSNKCSTFLMKPHKLEELSADLSVNGYTIEAKRILNIKSKIFRDN